MYFFVLFYVFFVLFYVFLCCSMCCLFCVVLCIVCVYMCTVLLPPDGYPIAFKYIISYHYPAHLQEVYIVTVYMQPLVSSLCKK